MLPPIELQPCRAAPAAAALVSVLSPEGEQCGIIVTRGVTSFVYNTAEFLDASRVNTWDTSYGVCQVTHSTIRAV